MIDVAELMRAIEQVGLDKVAEEMDRLEGVEAPAGSDLLHGIAHRIGVRYAKHAFEAAKISKLLED